MTDILITVTVTVVVLQLTAVAMCNNCGSDGCVLSMVSREEWGARKPKERQAMTTPVDTVVIHHTYIPGTCHNLEDCKAKIRAMQNFHMDKRGWNDIGYSFAIGLGFVFEGRGWNSVGAHAPPYNNHSIGIAFIGDYTEALPSGPMLCQCHQLISYGVDHNFILPDYQLIGHRQARPTECPGQKLYDLIKTWSHWKPITTIPS